LLLLFCLVMLAPGCQQVGPKNVIDRQTTSLESASPVTLQIEDADKKGVANGVGPARFTSITEGEVQTFQTGTTPRDLWVRKGTDGAVQVNLSSGTDIQAEGLEFDAGTGSFKVKRFGTSSSEPLRAGNEAYDRLVAYWTSLSQDQKEARLAEIDAMKVTAPELADLILGIVSGL
jgi:hypothetical protein